MINDVLLGIEIKNEWVKRENKSVISFVNGSCVFVVWVVVVGNLLGFFVFLVEDLVVFFRELGFRS